MPCNIASSSFNLWIFQRSVALHSTQSPKYEPTDQPLILLDLVVLESILLASDEGSLIHFPFLLAPLICSVGPEKTFRRTLPLKQKTFLFQAQKETLLMLY